MTFTIWARMLNRRLRPLQKIIKDAFNPEQFVPFVPESVINNREIFSRMLLAAAAFAVMLIVIKAIDEQIEENKCGRSNGYLYHCLD